MWLNFSNGNFNIKNFEKKISNNWQLKILNFLKKWNDNNSTICINTSGTTNKKKFFYVKKIYLINSIYMTKKFLNLKSDGKSLLCLSIDFIAAKMLLIRSLILKWNVFCVLPSSNPLNKINDIFDLTSMVPMQLYNSLNYEKKIKNILIGGGVISKKLQKKIQKSLINCYYSFGMTETLGHIAFKKLNGFNKDKYFMPLKNIKLNINKKGCLTIFAPKLMNPPFLETNDLVKIYKNGGFIWIGRYDNIINTGGIKIIPEIYEEKLKKYIDLPFFIAGINDDYLGEKVSLFIEGNEKKIPKNLFLYKKFFLKNIFFINKFLRTTSGKIKRKKTVKIFLIKKKKEKNNFLTIKI